MAPAKDRFGGTPATQGLPQGGGQIVTLPPPGAKTTLGKSGADTGKIVNLPGKGVGKIGERPAPKLDGKLGQVEKRTPKSSPLVGVQKEPAGFASAGNSRRVATSSQFRGSFGQAPAGGGIKMMR